MIGCNKLRGNDAGRVTYFVDVCFGFGLAEVGVEGVAYLRLHLRRHPQHPTQLRRPPLRWPRPPRREPRPELLYSRRRGLLHAMNVI